MTGLSAQAYTTLLPDDCPTGDVVLVFGGRDYHNKAFVWAALDALHVLSPIRVLVEGGARGADRLARVWALQKGISHYPVPADWDAWGSLAGPRRNLRMITETRPDVGVAFTGDRGTRSMVKLAKMVGLPLIDLRWRDESPL